MGASRAAAEGGARYPRIIRFDPAPVPGGVPTSRAQCRSPGKCARSARYDTANGASATASAVAINATIARSAPPSQRALATMSRVTASASGPGGYGAGRARLGDASPRAAGMRIRTAQSHERATGTSETAADAPSRTGAMPGSGTVGPLRTPNTRYAAMPRNDVTPATSAAQMMVATRRGL